MTVTADAAGDDIQFERRGALGLVTLNRPKALNALTHPMALALERQLDAWRDDDGVRVVAIRGAGDRAFCAGGDIRALWEAGRPGGERGRANFGFYADEYRLDWKIRTYPKPYVALMDGIVMGGGVGVSIHGSHRIATERTVFAMPETGIGLFPDVGATWFLPRMPGQTGMWLALTGTRLGPVDCLKAGVCDAWIPSERLDQVETALAEAAETDGEPRAAVDWAIEAFTRYPDGPSILRERAVVIDRTLAAETASEVLAALEADGTDWAREQAATIRAKSPTCTAIAFRQVRAGAELGFDDCMRLEYRLARFCMEHPDFYEGVRATIIEKGSAPDWSPASLDAVDPAVIDRAFAPRPDGELELPSV